MEFAEWISEQSRQVRTLKLPKENNLLLQWGTMRFNTLVKNNEIHTFTPFFFFQRKRCCEKICTGIGITFGHRAHARFAVTSGGEKSIHPAAAL